MNPISFLTTLESYYRRIKYNEETKKACLIMKNNKNYNFSSNYNKITTSFESFKDFAFRNISFEPILWAEKVFRKLNNQINEMIRTSNANNQILFKKIIEIEYSTSKKYEYFESILLGVEDLEDSTALLIFENNPEQIDLILSHNFDEGAIICGEIGNVPYIIFYYSKKIKAQKNYNNFNIKELSLDHPMFKNLLYLDKIIAGTFVISNSDKIKVRFKLNDGQYKNEEFKILFN